jgi:hypothetical protein
LIYVRFSNKFKALVENKFAFRFSIHISLQTKQQEIMPQQEITCHNGFLTDESVAKMRLHSLDVDAHPIHKLAEGMAFAETAQELPLPALIQVVGMRKNISKVAALALYHYHCSRN